MAENLHLTVLTDDTVAHDSCTAEHGLSVLLELPNGHRWLVDTGTTDIYLENARNLGVSLDGLNGIVITHGHDDHTGGLAFYSRFKGNPPIYGHPYIWHKAYQVKPGQPVRITGMPYMARKQAAPAFHPVNGTNCLDEGFYFFTDIPRLPGSFAPIGGNFFNEDGTGPVPLIDDATVAVRVDGGLVLVIGCGHAGYTNILEAVHAKFPEEKLLAVVGGMHLLNADETVLAQSLELTKAYMAENFVFYGGHCTGSNALAYFSRFLGEDRVRALGAGRVLSF